MHVCDAYVRQWIDLYTNMYTSSDTVGHIETACNNIGTAQQDRGRTHTQARTRTQRE